MSAPSFELPPSDLKLAADEIHIWFVVLDQPVPVLEALVQVLAPDERTRAERFLFRKDRRRFMARHGILRMILERYLGITAAELRFSQGKNGKPAISETFGNVNIRFNISHSNGAALFAFARNKEIGVDIEYICALSGMEKIVERFFSANENDAMRALPDGQKRGAFFSGWTRKEAFVKALGDGLSCPLDKFDVSLSPAEPAGLLRIEGAPGEVSRWSIRDVNPAPDYAGAFAVKSRLFGVKHWRWQPCEQGGFQHVFPYR